MANQTELLNVSDEMKLDDERQSFEGLECGEGLCSSSSDTTEELYSSSAPDTTWIRGIIRILFNNFSGHNTVKYFF